jgi:putative ABC transport system permease protein
LPAFRVTGNRLTEVLHAGAAAVVGGRGSARILSAIAAGQIAVVFVLATGAALMLESFWRMRYVNLGFQPERLVTATLTRRGPRPEFIQALLDRMHALPGVQSAAVTNATEIPPGHWHATNLFAIEGRARVPQEQRPLARYPVVSDDYFGLMKIPLVQGRLFQDSDRENSTLVAVVNRAVVRRYFPNEDPLGNRVRIGAREPWYTIVGVVGNVKMSGLAAAPEPAIYFHYRQRPPFGEIGLIASAPIDIAGGIRKIVADLDRNQPIARIQTMSERLSESVSKPRFTTTLLFAFACFAAVLGLIGVYGVMACRVRWQFRELALRKALGAQGRDVTGHVLKQGIAIIVAGLCVGLIGAVTAARLLSTVLFEVSPRDPRTFAAVAAGLIATALLACWVPARRAAGIDPLIALRDL